MLHIAAYLWMPCSAHALPYEMGTPSALPQLQGNVWAFLGSDADDSAAATPAEPAEAPRPVHLPTMYVTRQGNSLAAQSRPWLY